MKSGEKNKKDFDAMDEHMMDELLKKNREWGDQVVQLQQTVQSACMAVSQLAQVVEDEQRKRIQLEKEVNLLTAFKRNLQYEYWDITQKKENFFCPVFRSNEETLRSIIDEKKSMGRFGDGEFSLAYDIPRQKFQCLNEQLKKRIWQVLNARNDNYMIAIAKNYGCLEEYNEQSADGIRLYMTPEVRNMHERILPENTIFSNAYITRPYVLYKDNKTDAPSERFESLKRIWNDKNIVIVEGVQTRLGVGNDLFMNTKRIRRILAPATNSFDRYGEILECCLAVADSADLFLLAIGPSSGILAFDLSEKGYQAIDVGHIDLEYEWYLAGKGHRVSVPYKYNNEIPGGDDVKDICDPIYVSQIIGRFL